MNLSINTIFNLYWYVIDQGTTDPTVHELHTRDARNWLYSVLIGMSSHTPPNVETLIKYRSGDSVTLIALSFLYNLRLTEIAQPPNAQKIIVRINDTIFYTF
jgi:hypothetical protein